MLISLFSENRSRRRFIAALVGALFVLGTSADAQQRRRSRAANELDDVVFATSFSPDGKTLAIARGAGEPSQRYGRIELWDTKSGTLRHVIKGFDGPVRSVSFSPDGQTFVSGSSEYRTSKIQEKPRTREGSVFGELKWWDTQTGELKQKLTLPGDGNSSLRATYSPDGKQLVIVESFLHTTLVSPLYPALMVSPYANFVTPGLILNAKIKLLDAQTGELKLKLDASQPAVALFSPDGERLAARNLHWTGDRSEIMVWNVRTGRREHKLAAGTWSFDYKQPNAIAFSPDGRLLAIAITSIHNRSSRDFAKWVYISEVRLLDVTTWKVVRRLATPGIVDSLTFAPNGRVLLIAGEEVGVRPRVKFWDLQTGGAANLAVSEEDINQPGEYLFATGRNPEAIDSLALSPDGGLLALRVGQTTVKVFDTQTWKVKHTFDENSGGDVKERSTSRFVMSVRRVLEVAFSADGDTLAGELDHGEIKLWDHRTGEIKKRLGADEDEPSLVAIATDGGTLAEVSNGKLRVWHSGSEEKRILTMPAGGPISAIALSADGQTLAVGTGKELQLLNSATGQVLKTLASGQTTASRIVLSHDGLTLATADESGAIAVWDLANERIAKTLNAGSKVTALRFARDGRMLASATEDLDIAIWNLQTGSLQQKLQKHSAAINALAFSPNGELLASGGDDRTAVIWDTASGKSKRTFKGHDQTVTALAFSPDGTLLATAGGNAAVVLWDVGTGKLNRVLR